MMGALFGAIAFQTPLILLGLVALPILWWLLRAVPPAPVRRRFPGIALLLGLREKEPESERTPWWLLAIRVLALGAFITAMAGPVLNPLRGLSGQGPLLVALDASWASARDWPRHVARVEQALEQAGRAGRQVALVRLSETGNDRVDFHAASFWRERVQSLTPQPWLPQSDLPAWLDTLPDAVETLWLSDGLAREGRAELLAALQDRGAVQVFEPDTPLVTLAPPSFEESAIEVALRRVPGAAQEVSVLAIGRDPNGAERELAREIVSFEPNARNATARFELQPEQRNRITRFQLDGQRSAGAVALADDSLRRRKVALLSVRENTEALALLSPLHYLRQALAPSTDLIEANSLDDLLLAAPDVVVLADQPSLSPTETEALTEWLYNGGLLLRFAGPRLAGAGFARSGQGGLAQEDPLLPVALRAGGRTVGGAMSWGEPRALAPFAEDSPFAGLSVPTDVGITAQVLAQPGPDLAVRTIAALGDGTPLVTRAQRGAGQVVLFHVTANAEWSTLPLSGLFVQMLDRLAISTRGASAREQTQDIDGLPWQPVQLLDGFGTLHSARDMPVVEGQGLSAILRGEAMPHADLPPGLYEGPALRLAVNALSAQTRIAPADWPVGTPIETGAAQRETPLGGYLLAAAIALLGLDVLATLALGGLLMRSAGAAFVALALLSPKAQAQEISAADQRLLDATAQVTLAYVPTGETHIDEVAQAGLQGLSNALYLRTSVEPAVPVAVNIETDELALFPLIYWPVTETSPAPSAQASARLNRYLRSGGMIVFDTRDADIGRLTNAPTAAGRRLREITAGLDIPALETLPSDHVLTRAFYLLSAFPGRYANGDVWVEAAPAEAERAEGMPFRDLNDGVTPVVIGANDWAAAWAVDRLGMPLLPIGHGTTGERQREIALRFGINLVLYVLSGNYKSDQVHVPALLERLGE